MDPAKVAIIVNWPRLNTVTEIKIFPGAVQYWMKFIFGFSSISVPLHALTSVKEIFQWGGKYQRAFDTLKENIITAPVLTLPDLQQPFEIETDASGFSMEPF